MQHVSGADKWTGSTGMTVLFIVFKGKRKKRKRRRQVAMLYQNARLELLTAMGSNPLGSETLNLGLKTPTTLSPSKKFRFWFRIFYFLLIFFGFRAVD